MTFNKKGVELAGIMEDEIKALYKTSQEVEHVKLLLREAEEQTKRKEIKITRKIRPLHKFAAKLKTVFKYGLHWSKPFYPLRLARNILLSRLYRLLRLNRYVLRGCEFDITFKCNFSCKHCSVARLDESTARRELEIKDYEKIVKEAMKLGATSFGLEGGEPFVKKDWDKIIEICRPKHNHIIISTNGFLFDEEKAERCAELGVDTINFSLDNGIPDLHDLFRRKKGSYERFMKAIDLCKRYKIKPIINTVVHKNNLYTEGFRKILDFAEENKILVCVLFAKPLGSFKDDDSMLDDDDFEAYEKIAQPYACAFVHHDTQAAYCSKGCNGTKEMLQFTPYGDVMNCAHMHQCNGRIPG